MESANLDPWALHTVLRQWQLNKATRILIFLGVAFENYPKVTSFFSVSGVVEGEGGRSGAGGLWAEITKKKNFTSKSA